MHLSPYLYRWLTLRWIAASDSGGILCLTIARYILYFLGRIKEHEKRKITAMNPAYAEIIEQIREQCRRNHWFGPPELKPNLAAWAPQYHPNASNFVFPPATEDQLRQTEAILGWPLPPLLRALYTSLANGGFGPGAGIWGAVGGYGKPGTFEALGDSTIVARHTDPELQLFDMSGYANRRVQLETGPFLALPERTWPRQMISISDLGCAMNACIDAEGHFFIAGMSQYNGYGFFDMEISFEQWLRQWLRTGHTWISARDIS